MTTNDHKPRENKEKDGTMGRSNGRRLRGPLAMIGALALGLTGVAAAAPAYAAGPGNVPDGPYTLDIHKYAQPDEALGLANDGTEQTIPSTVTPLAGVEYDIAPVQGIDLTTAAGWQKVSILSVLPTGEVTDGMTTYSPGTATALAPTDAAGATSYTTAANADPAVYLVTETSAGANEVSEVAPPFLVTLPFPSATDDSWLTTVHAYPKNTVVAAPTKTVDDSAAHGLGDTVTWTIDSRVPNVADGTTLTSLAVKDTLDARLTAPATSDVTVTLTAADGSTDVPLDASDYTVTVTGQDVAVQFTASGLATLADNQGGTVSVQIPTVVNAVGDGTITNTPVTTVNGNDVTGDPAQTTWGALTLHKQNQDGQALSGAEFQVYRSEADAKAGTDPVSVGDSDTFTSDDSGVVSIDGLKSQQNGTGDNITYYLVETTAPAGYEVATGYAAADGGHAVTVYPGSTANDTITVTDAQVPAFALPLTGGTGSALFLGGGLALVLLAVAAGVVVARRRRTQALATTEAR